jgi:poly(A) polymerase
VPVGAQFGVITVVGRGAAGHVEVATFRQDSGYSDGRRPDAVHFSTPEADAQRRDFTINGLFYDPLEDRVIDYVNGVDDLKRALVRAIGDPRLRFEEDKLRLLRAVRFTATFNFSLDHETRQAVEAMADQIGVVSVERIAAEMQRMLIHGRRALAMELLRDVGLLAHILPELTAGEAGGPAAPWKQAMGTLKELIEPSFPLALAALLQPFVDGAEALAIGRRWKLSNDDIRRTVWLLEQRQALVGARQMKWSQLQPLLVSEGIQDLLALHSALAAATRGDASSSETSLMEPSAVEHCRELLKLPDEKLDPAPLLTGDDLIAHGVPRGKLYQTLLRAVRDAQLEGEIATHTEAMALVDRLWN